MGRTTKTEEEKEKETTAGEGTSTTETSTEGTGTGTGVGTNTKSTAGAETGAKEKEEKRLSGLVDVSDHEKERILKAKKKAGIISEDETKELRRLSKNRREKERYEKEMQEREQSGITQSAPIPVTPGATSAEPAKPKRRRASRKKKLDTEQVENLLYAVFGFIATKQDFEHWKMTKAQAKEIATPLCEVLEKYDKLSGISNNSAEIGLVIAVASFMVPNIVITTQKRKERKKDARGNTTGSVGNKLDENRPATKRAKPDTRPTAPDRSGNVDNDGIFGQALI